MILENQLTNEFFRLLRLHQLLLGDKPDVESLLHLGVCYEIKYGLCHDHRLDFERVLVVQLPFRMHCDILSPVPFTHFPLPTSEVV